MIADIPLNDNPTLTIEVLELRHIKQRTLRAMARIRAGGLVINGVAIVMTRPGWPRVVMPSRMTHEGERLPVVEIDAPALRAAISDAVIEAWRFGLDASVRGSAAQNVKGGRLYARPVANSGSLEFAEGLSEAKPLTGRPQE